MLDLFYIVLTLVFFALIGYLTGCGLKASVPSCTGARHASLLGSITPGAEPLPVVRGLAAPSRLVVHAAGEIASQ